MHYTRKKLFWKVTILNAIYLFTANQRTMTSLVGNIYTASRKNGPPKHIKITSSNTIRFYNLLEICNKAFIQYPTIPYTRRYTTLWNIDARKLAYPVRRDSLGER